MSGLKHRRFGPFAVWAGRGDGEHPSRWLGFYSPRIGEVEVHLTSDRVHRYQPQPGVDVWVDVPSENSTAMRLTSADALIRRLGGAR